jgi:hypothetical protein
MAYNDDILRLSVLCDLLKSIVDFSKINQENKHQFYERSISAFYLHFGGQLFNIIYNSVLEGMGLSEYKLDN